jgi:hypothetical protein
MSRSVEVAGSLEEVVGRSGVVYWSMFTVSAAPRLNVSVRLAMLPVCDFGVKTEARKGALKVMDSPETT